MADTIWSDAAAIGSGMNLERACWVALAVLIGASACFSTVTILSRAATAAGRMRQRWLCLAAGIFGVGVWTTHFVAMNAEPSIMVMHDTASLMLLAPLLAIGGALAAFALALASPRTINRIGAGLILAIAVTTMHFTAMAAMHLDGHLLYRPFCVLTAAGLGSFCAIMAFRQFDRIGSTAIRLEMATWLILGIAAIHFIAMAGTIFMPGAHVMIKGMVIGGDTTLASAAASALAIGLIAIISRHDQQWRQINQEAERLRQLANLTTEGLLIHHDGRAIWGNSALQRVAGLSADQIAGRDAAAFASAETRHILQHHLDTPTDQAAEIEILRPNGTRHTAEIHSRAIHYAGRSAGVIAVRDITERRRAEARISHLAFHDPLTGLGNRALFNKCLADAIDDAIGAQQPLALLTLDLDRFKSVNELHGHPLGDLLLKQVAARLAHNLRRNDTVVRLGGDEFAIIQPHADQPAAAAGLARRLVESLAQPFALDGTMVSIGASIGVALCPDNATTLQSLLQASDLALGRAKRDGRNIFCFFEAGMDAKFRERRLLEQELRLALEHKRLTVDYQPLVNCTTMSVVGFEALARWNHETRGPISPAEFIPIAEEGSLITLLGQFVLATACEMALTWPAHYMLAVNLSPVQFHNPHLAEDIIATLAEIGFPAERLELEVTEGILIDNVDHVLKVLGTLKMHGIHIALDDFGTGYSSLNTLRKFPFDKLKIDQSFVRNLGTDDDAAAIVRAILALGASLRLEVTAEGVETAIQLDALIEGGCDLVQGYFLGRPSAQPQLEVADHAFG